jgi:hypothetical protein
VSPIFVRPVREQLEHDRLIRHLQAKFTRKFEVGANLGDEQVAPLKVGANTFFPDLTLSTGGKVVGVIEVETGESVNNLEAMSQWLHFSRVKVPFSLYVPVMSYDTTRRLCEALGVTVSEIWTYRGAMEGFDLLRMFHDAKAAARAPKRVLEAQARIRRRGTGSLAAKTGRPVRTVSPPKPASKTKRVAKVAKPAKATKKSTKKAGTARRSSKASSARKASPARSSRATKAGARKK